MRTNYSTRPPDPLLGCRFNVEIDGVINAGFTEVSGLSVEIETETCSEGGQNEFKLILPKGVKEGTIVLKKGVIQGNDVMWNWFQGVLDKRILYKNLSILLLNPDGSTACRLEVNGAFPIKWEASQLTSQSGNIFMETLTLTHRGIRKC